LNAGTKKPATKVKRSYAIKTIKVLFGFCGNRCAEPSCTQRIIKEGTDYSHDLVVGQIAHIYAAADNGPRGKPGLTEKERNAPDNLILLCPTHHVVVDGQHQTYPATLLREWKEKRERPFREQIKDRINDLGYKELEFAAASLMSASVVAEADLAIVPPAEKIAKNGLGPSSANLLRMGASKSRECEEVIMRASQLNTNFAQQLRQGFVAKYQALRAEKLVGDDLFMAMYDWAAGEGDKKRDAAGLCVLAHLFIMCDVFEK